MSKLKNNLIEIQDVISKIYQEQDNSSFQFDGEDVYCTFCGAHEVNGHNFNCELVALIKDLNKCYDLIEVFKQRNLK
jgi:hypothetical protein